MSDPFGGAMSQAADQLVANIRRPTTRQPFKARVTAVSGQTVQVRKITDTTSGSAWLPVIGVPPAVGNLVQVYPDGASSWVVHSSRSFDSGFSDSLNGRVNDNTVQRGMTFKQAGSTVRTNPAEVNGMPGILITNYGSGNGINIAPDFGTGANQVAPGNQTLGAHSNVASGVDSASNGLYLVRSSGQWTAGSIPTNSGTGGGYSRDLARSGSTTSNVSSSTFATITDTSGSLSVTSKNYIVRIMVAYNILPGSSGALELQVYITSANGTTMTATGATAQTLMGAWNADSFALSGTVTWGVRFRSTGGTHAVRNGVAVLTLIPIN